jgi:hypothetical protein
MLVAKRIRGLTNDRLPDPVSILGFAGPEGIFSLGIVFPRSLTPVAPHDRVTSCQGNHPKVTNEKEVQMWEELEENLDTLLECQALDKLADCYAELAIQLSKRGFSQEHSMEILKSVTFFEPPRKATLSTEARTPGFSSYN